MRLSQGTIPSFRGYLLTTFFCSTLSLASVAQSKTMVSNLSSVAKFTPSIDIRPLSIGDQVPDIVFQNVLNYKNKIIKLSDFKGKFVILDMWSTWCTSCIEGFPKMEALQKKFGDKIQIILTNSSNSKYDSEELVRSTLNKLKIRTGFSPSLPVTYRDTILNTLFPHQTVPHVVIINEQGKVTGITYPYIITEENIQSLLTGKLINIPPKNDWAYNKNSPLLINGNGGDESEFLYRSILTKYKQGIGSFRNIIESDGTLSRLSVINYPLRLLYQIAYADILKHPNNRTLIETKNPSRFDIDTNASTKFNNVYCYELITSQLPVSMMFQYMREDLFRNFGIIAKTENRVIKCYVLKVNSNINKSRPNTDSSSMDTEKTSLKKFIHNRPVGELVDLLNSMLPIPVIDNTNMSHTISIDLPFDWHNLSVKEISAYLNTKGFDLIESEQNLEVSVITDRISTK